MVSKKYWEPSITEFVNLVNQTKEVKTVEILNTDFKVIPGVFSPIFSSDTSWFAEKIIPLTMGKKFLEIGSGTGIIACLASIHGAAHVTATDINPKAIENILENAKLHSLNISIREGSVFDSIDKGEMFDIIFWNHPFYYTDKKSIKNDMVNLSVYDTEYQFLRKFLEKGKHYLKDKGQLMLGTSNIARINLIKKMARDYAYKISLLEKVEVPIYKGKKVTMDLRIYTFVLNKSSCRKPKAHS